jgi:hypothetical protein
MRETKDIQPLADFDWSAVGDKSYSNDEKQKLEQAYDKTFNQIGDQQVVEGIVVSINDREGSS